MEFDHIRANTAGIERRFLWDQLVTVRAGEGEDPIIEGHAAVFDRLSVDLGGFREKIAPGAFAETIAADDIRALFNHDPNHVIGRNTAGTLQLQEDDQGLHMEATPADTQWEIDLIKKIRRKDITGQSFGFRTLADDWTIDSNEQVVRTLIKVKLYDVGPVTFPAYPQTDTNVRAAMEAAGFDLAQLGQLITRRQAGQLLPGDRALFSQFIQLLSAMAGSGPGQAAGPDDGDPDPSARARTVDRRRRQQLAELQ